MCVDYKSLGICTIDDFLIGRVPLVEGGWSELQIVDYHLKKKRDRSYARSDANFKKTLEGLEPHTQQVRIEKLMEEGLSVSEGIPPPAGPPTGAG